MISLKGLPGPKAKIFAKTMGLLNGGHSQPYPAVLSGEGEGCYVKDIDGNMFLDMTSLLCTAPLGFNHPRLLKIVRKYSSRAPLKIAGQDFYVQEHLTLLEELGSITPKEINAGFICNSGAEAVENALKIAFYNKRGNSGISLHNAFHGRTLGALSLTNSKSVHKNRFPSFAFHRLPFNQESVVEFDRILSQEGEENISFLIVEPVQGEGGYIPAGTWLKQLVDLAKASGVRVISDEIQAGLGRTGEWWSIQNYDAQPDIITSAKALQVGATMANRKLFPPSGAMSSTFGGGDILAMAVGTETIRVIKDEKLLDNVKKMGRVILERLQEYEDNISRIEGIGLMIGLQLHSEKSRDKLVRELFKRKVFVLPAGKRRVRLAPAYIIGETEIDKFFEAFDPALKTTTKH